MLLEFTINATIEPIDPKSGSVQFSSVSHSVVSDSLQPHESQHSRPPCPSPTPRVHELLIAKFRLKLKKVGNTIRPFRFDLSHIPYSYTVEVTNRSKGSDLIDRVPEELWTEVRDTIQEAVIKTIPQKK